MRGIGLVVLSAALLGGCSSVIEGRSQEIAINTTPSGASCTLNREGAIIGMVNPTPGTVIIRKDKYDIEVVCQLDGYQKATRLDESGTAAAVFGNILLGGAIGVVVDSATGSDNKYDTPLNIALSVRTDAPPPASRQIIASAPPAPLAPPIVASAPPALPAAASHSFLSEPSVVPSMAGTVDLQRARNAAERYRVLRQLVADGLVPRDWYTAWAQQNAGAFLLTTMAPPFAGVGNRPRSYQELAAFLRSVQAEKDRGVAEAERQALFRALMPLDGARIPAQKPPADADGLRNWYAFLDRVRDEGLLPAQSIAAEKAAINDARLVEGLPPVT